MSIQESKVDSIHTQIESIVRYFNSSSTAEHTRDKLYKLVNKINKPNKLNNLTDTQFNITMHHLRKFETKMYLYYCARETIERDLSRRLLSIDLTINDTEYSRGITPIDELMKTRKQADSIINLNKLFSLGE